jgi:hypothetical protein
MWRKQFATIDRTNWWSQETVYNLSTWNTDQKVFYMRYLALKREIALLFDEWNIDWNESLTEEQQVFERHEEFQERRKEYITELENFAPEVITWYPNPTNWPITLEIDVKTFMELHNSFRQVSRSNRTIDNDWNIRPDYTTIQTSEMESNFNPLHWLPVFQENDIWSSATLEDVLQSPWDFWYWVPWNQQIRLNTTNPFNWRVSDIDNTVYSPINTDWHSRDIFWSQWPNWWETYGRNFNNNLTQSAANISLTTWWQDSSEQSWWNRQAFQALYRWFEIPTFNLQTWENASSIEELATSFKQEYIRNATRNIRVFNWLWQPMEYNTDQNIDVSYTWNILWTIDLTLYPAWIYYIVLPSPLGWKPLTYKITKGTFSP